MLQWKNEGTRRHDGLQARELRPGAKGGDGVIYTFDAKGFLLYPVMKSYFHLNDREVYREIQRGLELLNARLAQKGIAYSALKGALVPNQDKDKFETCLVVDSAQIDASDYGLHVFERLIPLLDRESTYSILCGDYIDQVSGVLPNAQALLRAILLEGLERCHASRYLHSSQYFFIYFNRLSRSQRQRIIDGLAPYPWFTGWADLTYGSRFKSYLSSILVHVCVKARDRVIVSHPADYGDEENVNLRGFPFEAAGFQLLSVNEDSYGPFLSYKIESELPDRDDVSFSFNALFPRFDSLEKLTLNITDDKWNKYLADGEKGKGRLLEALGYAPEDRDRFCREIFRNICANYIYNLRENPYGDLMFDVCVELPTARGNRRKTVVAIKYHPDTGLADVVTVT